MKVKGTVKWFNDAKGFRFIEVETRPNEDIFVHYTAILTKEGEFKTLADGQQVLLELRENQKGLQAFEVEKVK